MPDQSPGRLEFAHADENREHDCSSDMRREQRQQRNCETLAAPRGEVADKVGEERELRPPRTSGVRPQSRAAVAVQASRNTKKRGSAAESSNIAALATAASAATVTVLPLVVGRAIARATMPVVNPF